ncbi:hypothetical protein AvCA_10990 [Azotobacter vinelandii CA]|uniref:Uncharacterized protein n=2 Tax=Azotobacter vinelandii TaxID=354 RepID=C1DP98_AZOVD|nr:hypothetical protein Avin_10990 [Azotobacter vinelandii DJ]AGK17091.1 hypothetical protein AvCA_10990 [Azotobacter vinelandii CA]AGK19723.1 hypothetical protein AvCA6_10990 [Azotobacter vinelandii CA6]
MHNLTSANPAPCNTSVPGRPGYAVEMTDNIGTSGLGASLASMKRTGR